MYERKIFSFFAHLFYGYVECNKRTVLKRKTTGHGSSASRVSVFWLLMYNLLLFPAYNACQLSDSIEKWPFYTNPLTDCSLGGFSLCTGGGGGRGHPEKPNL